MLSGLVHYLRTILKLSGGIIIWILNENYSLSDYDHILVVTGWGANMGVVTDDAISQLEHSTGG